ncbi:MAG: aldo/keto reductase [Nitrospirales bacterium]|nr:aldo/keto reductase [Nitrospirales bacterium]
MTFTTYNHVTIPALMYGTAWKEGTTSTLVELAVSSGFTAIDTANQIIHYREALVGEALLTLAEKGVSRESLFLQTKFTSVGGQDHRTPYDPTADPATQVTQSFESSLTHLHTSYVDAYVLHGPSSRMGLSSSDWAIWKALEGIYQAGHAKMIGISNVNAHQLQQLCEQAAIKPMVVQNRCFAMMGWDHDVRTVCRAYDIVYQGFSLLTANQHVLPHPEVHAMAERLSVTPAQVLFRFALQVGMLPLTGTTSAQHMKEDLHILDGFELTSDEVTRLEMINMSV